MARKKQEVKEVKEGAPSTRAEKKEAAKALIREILAVKPLKHNELIDEVSKLYATRFAGEETENINDVKGRVGSVLDIMKKDSDVAYEDGMYALKARAVSIPEPEKQPEKKTRTRKKTEEKAETKQEEKTPAEKKPRAKKAKTEEVKVAEAVAKTVAEEKPKKPRAAKKKAEPLPAAPIQPIAPVAPITPETAPEPIPEEQAAPKKRGRKPKAKAEEPAKAEEAKAEISVAPITPEAAIAPKAEEKPEVKTEEKAEIKEPLQLVVKEKAEVANKGVVMDMSFLFGDRKPVQKPVAEQKSEQKPTEQKPVTEKKTEIKTEQKSEKKPDVKLEQKPVQKQAKTEEKTATARKNVRKVTRGTVKKPVQKLLTADEKLKEAFLKRIRTLGGDYFEYYSVYLLERYSMKNGRRLEGLRISGGDHDGGIDGEIELTDKLGFRETIYIQSKNWNPEKGDERLWVVGETLLQQFIGACACRQAKDGKQHCRGIFITTSRFTPEAKRILNDLSDKIVGYDGDDVYEAAKECGFGLVFKNGEWVLDEKLLSGSKAFFNLV